MKLQRKRNKEAARQAADNLNKEVQTEGIVHFSDWMKFSAGQENRSAEKAVNRQICRA
jgi:hypothetical protein